MDADTHFLDRGVQYYAAGRCAVLAGLIPVAGNLFHHAVEMLLKAHLSQTHSLRELSFKPFGHHLKNLWDVFKSRFPDENLDEFDQAISLINEFEELRYPDSAIANGAEIRFQWNDPPELPMFVPGDLSVPQYDLVVNTIDRLVATIFQVSSRNPAFFTIRMNENSRNAIYHSNPIAEFLFSDQA